MFSKKCEKKTKKWRNMTNFTFLKTPQACELKIKIRENICQIFKIVFIYVLIAEGLEVPGLHS